MKAILKRIIYIMFREDLKQAFRAGQYRASVDWEDITIDSKKEPPPFCLWFDNNYKS